MIIVLTPKGNTDTQGIVYIDTLWKVAEDTIDTSLKAYITCHDILHGFHTGIPGTAILELKLT